jgi:epoxyqueuosine reductase
LQAQGWTIHAFFYNPNIQPFGEFRKRLETMQSFAHEAGLPLIERHDYEPEEFFRQVVFREHRRCIHCYSQRLEAAARLAAKSRFDAFTSTLLYSKHQKHDLIRSIAEEASRKYKIQFHYHDFREGWKAGRESARTRGLYMQQYCGCLYSEKERFCPPNPMKTKTRDSSLL